jgi:hypothetical protein
MWLAPYVASVVVGYPTAVLRASPSLAASSAVNSTTSRPPPSSGTRMTMPRPSLVTSSGPSPVRGFIAAIIHPLPPEPRAQPSWDAALSAPAAEPASHNRFDQSPYYLRVRPPNGNDRGSGLSTWRTQQPVSRRSAGFHRGFSAPAACARPARRDSSGVRVRGGSSWHAAAFRGIYGAFTFKTGSGSAGAANPGGGGGQ